MFLHSIRWRVQLWHTLLLASIVGGLLYMQHRHEREMLISQLDRELQRPITRLLPYSGHLRAGVDEDYRGPRRGPRGDRPLPRGLRRPPPPGEESAVDFNGDPPLGPAGSNGPTRGRDGFGPGPSGSPRSFEEGKALVSSLEEQNYYVRITSPGAERPLYITADSPANASPLAGFGSSGTQMRTAGGYREAIHTNPRGTVILVGASMDDIKSQLASHRLQLIGIGLGTIVVAFAVGYLLTARSLHPIGRIGAAAREVASGKLDSRIDTDGARDELNSLAVTLNETFSELDAAFTRQARFTADASHELRTPIAVIMAKAQLALSKERDAEHYKRALGACEASAQHMRGLVDALLTLSHFDSSKAKLNKGSHDLCAIVSETVGLIQPLAEERSITINTDLAPTNCLCDREMLHQVATNILSNAVKYNIEGGEITAKVSASENEVSFTVADTGPGILEEDLPHIFERFYRVDRARTTTVRGGSTGLGLAITKAIIDAHDGSISAECPSSGGTVFTVTLPMGDTGS